MATATFDYYHAHREEFLEGLKNLLRIPSISTLPEHKPDIRRAAEFLAGELRGHGHATRWKSLKARRASTRSFTPSG